MNPSRSPKRWRGRPPNWEGRKLAAELRAHGLTLQKIGERLGVTRQAVSSLLSGRGRVPPVEVRCAACRAVIITARMQERTVGEVLCPVCLAARPGVPFGQRLRSLRVAAGMTRTALANAAGVLNSGIKDYEDGKTKPRPATRAKLAAALGAKELERFGEVT